MLAPECTNTSFTYTMSVTYFEHGFIQMKHNKRAYNQVLILIILARSLSNFGTKSVPEGIHEFKNLKAAQCYWIDNLLHYHT